MQTQRRQNSLSPGYLPNGSIGNFNYSSAKGGVTANGAIANTF
ncbi:hypothetical protein SAMN04487898_12915 [Pedobacter sp. ok626]|nr:hypothetical protein [Pedobacter sp. ok626]SDL92368.1 hypothetical protein SAMN04487898_12915 [Pedobacter sp. ok626]